MSISPSLMMKQILLLTDGYSNRGESPVIAASRVRKKGIRINVIGVADRDFLPVRAAREIENVAVAGGGFNRVVTAQHLSETVQLVTRQATMSTMMLISERSDGRFRASLEELPPQVRRSVVQRMEELEAQSILQLLILIDTSASMRSKLPAIQKTLLDLSIQLRSRRTPTCLALYTFPDVDRSDPIRCHLSWTSQLKNVDRFVQQLSTDGMTPTGPALRLAASEFDFATGWSGHVIS